MKTLTVSEASGNLGAWLELAIAGEDIGIRAGDMIVALRPVMSARGGAHGGRISPREALRMLQQQPRLSGDQPPAI